MFFNSVKEIKKNKINRLISKEMSDIYLWRDLLKTFLGLKKSSPFQFWGAPTHGDIIEHLNLLQLKNKRSGSKTVCGFSIIFILKGIMSF